MLMLLLAELTLPLLLILWLAIRPLPPRLPLLLQILSTAALLLALTFAGIWPAWWLPWAYWLGLLIAMSVAVRRAGGPRPSPRRAWTWGAVAALAILGLIAIFYAGQAVAGRSPPAKQAIDLEFPLRGGRYYVVNGGYSELISSHMATLPRATVRQRTYYGQSYAVDVVEAGRWGFTSRGLLPRDPGRYAIFGEPIVAPCTGIVVQTVDGLPDMQVPQMDAEHMAGNHVLLRCGRADILLAHMRSGSVRVAESARVGTGQLIGAVGNSGNSSLPHLHVHAQEPGTKQAPLSGAPIPVRFGGRFLYRGDLL
jgi:hypothetical protein